MKFKCLLLSAALISTSLFAEEAKITRYDSNDFNLESFFGLKLGEKSSYHHKMEKKIGYPISSFKLNKDKEVYKVSYSGGYMSYDFCVNQSIYLINEFNKLKNKKYNFISNNIPASENLDGYPDIRYIDLNDNSQLILRCLKNLDDKYQHSIIWYSKEIQNKEKSLPELDNIAKELVKI